MFHEHFVLKEPEARTPACEKLADQQTLATTTLASHSLLAGVFELRGRGL